MNRSIRHRASNLKRFLTAVVQTLQRSSIDLQVHARPTQDLLVATHTHTHTRIEGPHPTGRDAK